MHWLDLGGPRNFNLNQTRPKTLEAARFMGIRDLASWGKFESRL